MLNKKDLRAAVPRMREVAQLLAMWADDLESSLGKGGGRKAPAAPADDPAATDPPAELTYEKVREYLGKKSAAGYSAQVQALIRSCGAAKLSEVDPVHYPALLEAAKKLGGDADAG